MCVAYLFSTLFLTIENMHLYYGLNQMAVGYTVFLLSVLIEK